MRDRRIGVHPGTKLSVWSLIRWINSHGTKTLRTNISEMKALLTYEMVGTQGALTREESSEFYQVLSLMNASALTECVSTPSFLSILSCFALRAHPQFRFFSIVNTMAISKQRSEKYYSPPLMIHHPRLYEVPERRSPPIMEQDSSDQCLWNEGVANLWNGWHPRCVDPTDPLSSYPS